MDYEKVVQVLLAILKDLFKKSLLFLVLYEKKISPEINAEASSSLQKQSLRVFCEKRCYQKFCKFTGKHLC